MRNASQFASSSDYSRKIQTRFFIFIIKNYTTKHKQKYTFSKQVDSLLFLNYDEKKKVMLTKSNLPSFQQLRHLIIICLLSTSNNINIICLKETAVQFKPMQNFRTISDREMAIYNLRNHLYSGYSLLRLLFCLLISEILDILLATKIDKIQNKKIMSPTV